MQRQVGSLLAAFGLGAVSVLAWAPLSCAPILWLSLGLLYLLLGHDIQPRRAAAIGLAFGLGLFLFGVSWVYVSLSVFGGMPPVLAALSTFLFCLVLALFPALALAVFAAFRNVAGWKRVLLFAALLGFADWLRGWVFTGFPWLALGYTQTPGGALPAPFQAYAPVLGVYGVSVLVALCGGVLGELLSPFVPGRRGKVAFPRFFCDRRESGWCKWSLVTVTALLIVAGVLAGRYPWTAPSGTPIKVALLQGNIEQDMKWNPVRFADTLNIYYDLAARHPAQLTVFPETALPTFYDQLPENYLRELKALARREPVAGAGGGDIVFGSVVGNNRRYTNSVVSLGAAPEQRYDKSHLVPYGEYTPPGFAWFMRWLDIPMSGFAAGAAEQAPFVLSGQTVAFNICYEDVFGEAIARVAANATILVNVSNTAWFGRSWAQPQHLQIARMRALETGRPMLRATNTGMTAALRPDGTLQGVLPPFTRGGLVLDVQGMSGLTPYVRFGNAGALLLIVLFSLPALVSRRKSR